MEQHYQNLQIVFLAQTAVLVIAIVAYFKQRLENATKQETANIDDTAMRNKISAEAQSIIQRLFVEKDERMNRLEDTLQHQRDLIDNAESERSRVEGEKNALERQLNAALTQQAENIQKLASMEAAVSRLPALEAENISLKGQVADLRQKVEDAAELSNTRHAEMNRITGENAELYIKLRQANIDLENARRLLRECNDLTAAHEAKYPDLKQAPELLASGTTPADQKIAD